MAPTSHAQDPNADHNPCVSNREFNSLRANTYRHVVEQRWEVLGKGVRVDDPLIGRVIAYRWCGHGNVKHAYIAVRYRNGGKSGWAEQYDCRWEGNTC
jgi:hypothetical protein